MHTWMCSQTDSHFPPSIQQHGAKLLCLCAIPQIITKKAILPEWILASCNTFKLDPMNIQTWDGEAYQNIVMSIFQKLNIRSGLQPIGYYNQNGIGVNFSGRQTNDFHYMIRQWETNSTIPHYTLHNKIGVGLYNPNPSLVLKRPVTNVIYRLIPS